MKAQVTLTNGSVLEKTFTMGVPGSTTNGSYNYVKNEEVISSTLTPATVALARPAISSFSFSNSSFTVVFVANDTNRHNGWIWFYTNTGIFVGYSPYFLDGKTGECFSGFNSGHGFQSLNTVVLTNSDIVDSNGYAISASNFNLIKQCRVVITDGKQFEPTSYNNYAYRAISSCSTVN